MQKEYRFSFAICFIICYCLLSNGLMIVPALFGPDANVLSHGLVSQDGNETLSIDLSITAGLFEMNATASLFRIGNPDNTSKIVVYYDSSYPTYMKLARILGLQLHLESESSNRGLPYEVKIIDASQFADILVNNQTDYLVLIPTSILPAVVYSDSLNLITPWLRNGGKMVWMGFSFAGFYSYGNEFGPVSTYGTGQSSILGYNLNLGFGESNSSSPSSLMKALGLQWVGSRFGPEVKYLEMNNATILGAIDDGNRTSIAFCPVGNGGVLIFGDYVSTLYGNYPEAIIANDIAQILFSHALSNIHSYTSQSYILQKHTSVTLSLEITYLKGAGFSLLIIYATDMYYHRFCRSSSY